MKRQDYDEFLKKFTDNPKTTDECYTPFEVISTVTDYVCDRYHIDPETVVRPFYPGGDYQAEDYTGKVVIDNPPFSILRKIVRWYLEHGVRFWLFAPFNACPTHGTHATFVSVGARVVYGNGAVVRTSFCTNLEPGLQLVTDPVLRDKLEALAPRKRLGRDDEMKRYVITPATSATLASHGKRIEIAHGTPVTKWGKSNVYGGGYLLTGEELHNWQQLRKECELEWVKAVTSST